MKTLITSSVVWLAFQAVGLSSGQNDVTQYNASRESVDKVTFFETRIRPILVKHCYQCHASTSDEIKGGLRLDSRTGWQVGGDSGPAIVPGKPKESPIFLAISRSGELSEMPPKSRLPEQIVSDFQ